MQFYANSKWHNLKTILFIIAILFVAYLPVSSFLFFLKNDAFTGYFPPKFFMSESLHAGYLPLWNPYINFGIPQYGDMSSGFWSPVTWLIASTVGYNAYTFTLEVLLYILLGGVGLYKLTSTLQLNKNVCFISAVAYLCCGYNVGHLQHFNWLSGAAFLPLCLWSYLLLMRQLSFKNVARCAFMFYMLIASAHPGITICALYFFTAFAGFELFNNNTSSLKKKLPAFIRSHVFLLSLIVLLSTGMICGYLDFLPHFVRGEKINLADSLLNPTSFQSWISSLLPFAITKNDAFFNTDISMRNCYFSLVLLLFFLYSLIHNKTSLQKFLLITGLLFMLLSAGGMFKTFAYKFISLIGYVRLNGEFRIFSLLCFILIAAIEANKFIKEERPFSGSIKYCYYLLEIALAIAIALGIYKCSSLKQGFIFRMMDITSSAGLSQKLKVFIDAISFYDALWMQGLIQLFLLWLIKYSLRSKKTKLLRNIVIADMIIACLLNIPFTGVGKASVAQVQSILNRSAKGIPAPALIPINKNDTLNTEEQKMVGNWSMYGKQPGTIKQVAYPIVLKNMDAYFEQDSLTGKVNHLDKPFIYIDDSSASINDVSILSYSPQKIELTVNSKRNRALVLQQNSYPHWYYKNGDKNNPVNDFEINFMSAPLTQGTNKISFIFDPVLVKYAMAFSLVIFIFCCCSMLFSKSKPTSPS